jgi:hypothetical protein
MTVAKNRNGGSSPGPSVDAVGSPVIDPTSNVTALVKAGLQRQDDLRQLESEHIHEISKVRAAYEQQLREGDANLATLRSEFEEKLRTAESARIDAIRAVDVAAVAQAAAVSATQAMALQTQVNVSAETLRNQVATVAAQQATALAAALQPINKDIGDLRQAQYQQQGQATQKTEGKDSGQWLITTLIAVATAIAVFLFSHPTALPLK